MYRSNEELFKHIFDEIVFLESETRTISEEVFLKDEKTQRAFARSIEIIGEAVKNISSDVIIKYKEVPWRNIAGMRDKLIHGYFSVDYEIVWDVAKNIIPEFKNQLIKIMDTEKRKMTIKEIITEINKIEIDIADFISSYKSEQLVSNYDDWNYKDVIAHLLEWIMFSKNKLNAIVHNQDFQEISNIDIFNKQNYIKNKNKHITELQKKLIFELNEYKNIVLLYTEADLQRKDLPTGFSFELWRYMIMDTIIHPVMHLLYYLIKTKNYKLFFKLRKKYNEIFYCYAKGNIEVYSFYEYIEDSKKFIENIKELGEQYKNDDMIHAVLKANKIDENI